MDAEGQPCKMPDAYAAIVTTEPEWDDETRGRAMRLQEYEEGMCTCGCGQPMAEAHDPTQPYIVDTFTCQAGRAIELVKRKRKQDAENRNAGEGWDDGLHFYPRKPTTAELASTPPMRRRDASVTKLEQVRRTRGRKAAR